MNTNLPHFLKAFHRSTAILSSLPIAALAVSTAQAQTTRVWSGPTNGQYNDFNNWTPSGTWANGDTLRYDGSVVGNLNLNYQGGQNTGVLLDFTAAQTGTVGISLINEETQSRNFRLANATNTSAITIAADAGKVTLNGQSETFRMGALFGPNTDPGGGRTIFIDNAGTLEFGAFTTLSRAQTFRNVDLILRGGGQTTILGQVNDFGLFGGIRVDQNSVLTLSGTWVANTRLMIDQGRTDFTSAAAIGGNQTAWNSIRIGNNISTGVGTLRYTGTGDAQVDRRIQIGNGANANQTGSAIIENTSATGKLVFGNSIFNANGADPLSFGNVNTAAARTLTLGGNNTLANEITGQIIDNSATGTIGVIKEGDGRWILSGDNTYTGNTTVSAGTLALGAGNTLPDASLVSIGAATLDAGTFTDTCGTLDVTAAATINLGSGARLAFSSGTATWAGNLNLTGTLDFSGGPTSSLNFGSLSGLSGAQLLAISATGFDNFALDAEGDLTATPTGSAYGTFVSDNGLQDPWLGIDPALNGEPDADPDNDGFPNAVEFVLGEDPTSGTVVNPPTATSVGTNLVFTFRLTDQAASYDPDIWEVEYDADLVPAWSVIAPGDPEVSVGGDLGGYRLVTVTIPKSGNTKLFARLGVTIP